MLNSEEGDKPTMTETSNETVIFRVTTTPVIACFLSSKSKRKANNDRDIQWDGKSPVIFRVTTTPVIAWCLSSKS
ncbi:hypothetical protein J6590_085127 [Homalodisca vitripennis]|nr:hypothetical protein J6590_085127 [Homalodisca vitripennis]